MMENSYDFKVDIWSLGCCLFEIVTGSPPFRGEAFNQVQTQVLNTEIQMPAYLSKDFRSLLDGLLEKNVNRRLTMSQIKQHNFFKGVNWKSYLLNMDKLKPPLKSKIGKVNFNKNLGKTDILKQSEVSCGSMSLPGSIKK